MTIPATLLGLLNRYSPSGEEDEAVNFLVEQMQTLGYSQAYRDEVGNAIGIMGDGEQQIVLLGHIDTVPGEINVRQEDGLLFGRGSVDAKGPLAVFTDAVAATGAVPGYQFVVIGALDEERDSIGARHIIDQFQPAMAIIGEPSAWDRITLGYKGSAWAKITTRCDTAHSAHEDQTAAEVVVQDWLRIQAWTAHYNASHESAFEQLSATLMSMTSDSDGIEDTALLEINFRLPLAIDPPMLYRQLGDILQASQLEEKGYPISAYLGDKNTPLVRAFLRAIREQEGQPRFVRKTGTADMNLVAPTWDCPMLAYGPGDSALDHTPNEHISLNEYHRAVKILVSVLETLSTTKS